MLPSGVGPLDVNFQAFQLLRGNVEIKNSAKQTGPVCCETVLITNASKANVPPAQETSFPEENQGLRPTAGPYTTSNSDLGQSTWPCYSRSQSVFKSLESGCCVDMEKVSAHPGKQKPATARTEGHLITWAWVRACWSSPLPAA